MLYRLGFVLCVLWFLFMMFCASMLRSGAYDNAHSFALEHGGLTPAQFLAQAHIPVNPDRDTWGQNYDVWSAQSLIQDMQGDFPLYFKLGITPFPILVLVRVVLLYIIRGPAAFRPSHQGVRGN